MEALLLVSLLWNGILLYDVFQKKTRIKALENRSNTGNGGATEDAIEYNPRNYHSKK